RSTQISIARPVAADAPMRRMGGSAAGFRTSDALPASPGRSIGLWLGIALLPSFAHRTATPIATARRSGRRVIDGNTYPRCCAREQTDSWSENIPWASRGRSLRFDIWDYDEMVTDSCG